MPNWESQNQDYNLDFFIVAYFLLPKQICCGGLQICTVGAPTIVGDPIPISNFVYSTLRSITMLCGLDNILQNIPMLSMIVENIPHNIVMPTKHYYGFE